MSRMLPLKQHLGPVTVVPCASRLRLLECEVDGAVDVIDLERDIDGGSKTLITFLARHGHCGGVGAVDSDAVHRV